MKPAMKRIFKPLFKPRSQAGGFALPTAIFLLVVMAALGGFMMNFSTNTAINSAQDVQGTRVYWAARAGVEWAVSSILYAGNCDNPPVSFEGFAVSIVCTSDAHDENGTVRTIWRVVATANSTGAAGALGYVERELSATVER